MQLKTSTALSLKFTLYVIGLFLLLGVFVNLGNTFQRYSWESRKLQIETQPIRIQIDNILRPRKVPDMRPIRENVMVIAASSGVIAVLEENTLYRELSKIDDNWVLYRLHPNGERITLVNVSHHIDMEVTLLWIWFIALCVFASLTYIVSLFFVRNSLSRLRDLTHFVKQLDIHKLDTHLPVSGPEDDEIRQISSAINSSLDTIHQQTNALKDFVSFASHELKTPLMSMNANLDVVEKTQDFWNFIQKQKSQLQRMNGLFEKLLLITKQEFHAIQFKEQDVVPLLQRAIHQIAERFPTKKADIILEHPTTLLLKTDSSLFESIVSNLLVNACKYTLDGNPIVVSLNQYQLSIKDTGVGISQEDQEKIWERFRKKNGDGYGLWLYLVKLLVEKHDWKIAMESELGKGSTFFITF